MTTPHPLFFVDALVGRLTSLQSRLDRLDDLLPPRALSPEGVREFALLQKSLLELILDTRNSERELLGALEPQFPEYLERSRALADVADLARRQDDEMEGCPHRCWLTTVLRTERGVPVALYDRIPECLAEELKRRYPRHFEVTRHPVNPQESWEAPDLPGFEGKGN